MNRLVKLFIQELDTLKFVHAARAALMTSVLAAILAGCGGGSSQSTNGLLTTNPDPVVDPQPPAPPSPTNSPVPTQPPLTGTPTPTPAVPPVTGDLEIIESEAFAGTLTVSWTDVNADLYRLLYWQGNNAPAEHYTSDPEFSVPAPPQGDYTVIVEAYDALGNSVFSAPDFVEVTR